MAGPKSIVLSDGGAEAAILPEIGAGLAWYDLVDGNAREPLFRPRRELANVHPFDLANILLVPWSNRVSGGGFAFAGEFHALTPNMAGEAFPIHGDGFSCSWEVETHSANRIALSPGSDGPEPFRYRASATYELSEGALAMSLSATNAGDKALPFGLGLHPWLVRTPQTSLRAVAKSVELQNGKHLPAGTAPIREQEDWDFRRERPLPESLVNNAFLKWDGSARVVWADRRLAMDISAKPPLSTYIVYSPGAEADFFCFEPVTHGVDAHNRPGGALANRLAVLRPGESLAVSCAFAPRRL